VCGVLKSCGSVIVVCNYGVLKSCGSVNVVCEYNGILVDVYGNKKKGECNCGGRQRN
jgi:hypothetical protein